MNLHVATVVQTVLNMRIIIKNVNAHIVDILKRIVRLILEATGKILRDRNQVGNNELTCSHCGANSFEYDNYYKEHTCKQCGYIEKNQRDPEKLYRHANELDSNGLTCSNCGANSFEYDNYYKEHTCKHCGYIEKNQ